jgi:hypothetical protein
MFFKQTEKPKQKELRKLIREERQSSNHYHKLGMHRIAAQEFVHSKILEKKLDMLKHKKR